MIRISWQSIVAVALIAAVAFAGWKLYEAARDDVLDDIEDQNEEAGDAALEAITERHKCVEAGGVWEFVSGGAGRCRPS